MNLRYSIGFASKGVALGLLLFFNTSPLFALPLPDNSTTSSPSPALQITNTGTGQAGSFQISNANNATYALFGQSNGKGISIYGNMAGSGRAGVFQINNLLNLNNALTGYTSGKGSAGFFQINNAGNNNPTLYALTNGGGPALKAEAGTGLAGQFTGNVTISGSLAVGSVTATGNVTATGGVVAGSILSSGTVGSNTNVLELKANGERLFRLERPAASISWGYSPNLSGGFFGNEVSPTAVGATISGGGTDGFINRSFGSYGTVSGGYGNTASAAIATVSGGRFHTASGFISTVGGGDGNTSSGNYSTVGGGEKNTASGIHSTVGGGQNNSSNGLYSTVGGGSFNTAAERAVVSGGHTNTASAAFATVSGGLLNVASAEGASVGGGSYNAASGPSSAVAGGYNNAASGASASVSGGDTNIASGGAAIVAGGYTNTASGTFAIVGGGTGNVAQGAASFAGGVKAKANHDGTFVWGDNTNAELPSTGLNQFMVRATGGIYLYSGVDPGAGYAPSIGVVLAPNSGSWASTSDRNLKHKFKTLDPAQVLLKLNEVPITEWSYKAQGDVRHIGPMAQDFYRAFGLGNGDKTIDTIDADGVMMAAIQGLHAELKEEKKRNEELRRKNSEMEARLARLERLITKDQGR